ncbi:MAG: tryptophan 2,3-dioxygenase family protein [Ardenticatenaceae bacterium]|nr:tryptophan 2,3-dioxygenase family protein [Ardenticatenaceae bacterium]
MNKAAVDYSSYLQLDKILNAQAEKSAGPEHDEMLFIVIHQVYELWFKQILHELDYLVEKMVENDQSRILHTLRRLLTILKTVVAQIDVLETMTPLEFNAFRSYLETASGFQSIQFRELEFALGYKRLGILNSFPKTVPGVERLQRRYEQRTLWDAFLSLLNKNGHPIEESILARDVTQPVTPSAHVQEVLLNVYRHDQALIRVCERLIDFDEGIQEWRYRHVKMVERTIGSKRGTGGSAGAEYLRTTLKPVFPDLWAIRAAI